MPMLHAPHSSRSPSSSDSTSRRSRAGCQDPRLEHGRRDPEDHGRAGPGPAGRGADGLRWPAIQAMEVVYYALSQAIPGAVPACSGGDINGIVWWGVRERTGEPWADGSPHPIGQGGCTRRRRELADPSRRGGDTVLAGRGLGGAEPVATREGRASPRLVRARAQPGRARRRHVLPRSRGLVCDDRRRADEVCSVGARGRRRRAAERPRRSLAGRPPREAERKEHALRLPKGSTLEPYNGGGGYGPASERAPEAVRADSPRGLRDGGARAPALPARLRRLRAAQPAVGKPSKPLARVSCSCCVPSARIVQTSVWRPRLAMKTIRLPSDDQEGRLLAPTVGSVS
jgi:hypothetical protein